MVIEPEPDSTPPFSFRVTLPRFMVVLEVPMVPARFTLPRIAVRPPTKVLESPELLPKVTDPLLLKTVGVKKLTVFDAPDSETL